MSQLRKSKRSNSNDSPHWRDLQRQNFTRWLDLAKFLELNDSQRQQIDPTSRFPLNLPKRLAEKIEKGTLDDPILNQFLPKILENVEAEGFGPNPVAEDRFRSGKKLLIKYVGRALLICTSACVMNCRFCFRRHFPYDRSVSGFSEELQMLRDDASIQELLLSGGDPLSLDDTVLDALFTECDAIPHLKRIRFHTRFPVGVPERIDASFLKVLSNRRVQIWFVLHCNHAAELDAEVIESLKVLQRAGIPVLTQTVLLKGVNDSVEALRTLFERLIDNGITPYYLHMLDPVAGAAHFEVAEDVAVGLMKHLRDVLPGYAVPRLVRETPGLAAKELIV